MAWAPKWPSNMFKETKCENETSFCYCFASKGHLKSTKSESKSIFFVVASPKGLVVMSLYRLKGETKKNWTSCSSRPCRGSPVLPVQAWAPEMTPKINQERVKVYFFRCGFTKGVSCDVPAPFEVRNEENLDQV